MKDNYVSKATVSKITATSRASVKIKDSYYTVEFSEEKIIPDMYDMSGVDINAEKEILWDEVNREVDIQIEDIIRASKK